MIFWGILAALVYNLPFLGVSPLSRQSMSDLLQLSNAYGQTESTARIGHVTLARDVFLVYLTFHKMLSGVGNPDFF